MDINTFISRRIKLSENLADNSMVCVFSGINKIRNNDVEYPFRASSDFRYLTGFIEPNSTLIIIKNTKKYANDIQCGIFLREKDTEQETWQGKRLGVKNAAKTLGLDFAYKTCDMNKEITNFFCSINKIYINFSEFNYWSKHLSNWIKQLKSQHRTGIEAISKIIDLDNLLHEQRLYKSKEEIKILKQAAQVTVKGHLSAMNVVKNNMPELSVQAEIESTFKKHGSIRTAFSSIVAGGKNACTLHYTNNNSYLKTGNLVLIDAGAEIAGYAGDVTTTFPVSGKFTKEQKALYELVLLAQTEVIKSLKVGIPYDTMNKIANNVITQGLLDLKILHGNIKDLLKNNACKKYFIHGVGHWLGMDVHDVGSYKIKQNWRPLEVGMVVTVEPGIYIPSKCCDVDKKWRGIGIRIEDDIVITNTGHEVLTQGLPRTINEIETFMQKNNNEINR